MPWQPTHICVFCEPAAALPAGGLPCAQASVGNNNAAAARRKNIAGIMVRSFCEASAAASPMRKLTFVFYGLAASTVKRETRLSLEQVAFGLYRLPFVGIGRRRLAFDNRLPQFCQLGVHARARFFIVPHGVLPG